MSGYEGRANPSNTNSDYNAHVFLIEQILRKCNTTTLVKVVKCTNSGGVSPVGFVDVQPMVKFQEGSGGYKEHGVIYNCIYSRIQGGTSAVIIDPEVGDIGACSFADRDISSVKVNKKISIPGSGRTFDFADGIYFGGVLNGAPTQYVRFSSEGIEINSPTLVKLIAPDIQISGQTLEIDATVSVTVTTPNFNVIGDASVTGALLNNTKDIGYHHTHGGVEPGAGITGYPV